MNNMSDQNLKNNCRKNITRMFLKYIQLKRPEIYSIVKYQKLNLRKIVKDHNLKSEFDSFLDHFPNKEEKLGEYFNSLTTLYNELFVKKQQNEYSSQVSTQNNLL